METLKKFWNSLLEKIGNKINRALNKNGKLKSSVTADDDTIVNFFMMILKKILNRALMQCEFEVITDTAVAEPLIELCEDLQNNCYKIGAYMLGGSDTEQQISECWVVPYFDKINGENKLRHSYINGSRFRITRAIGERITECYMILESIRKNDKNYFLCRKHSLDEMGNLTVSFFVCDDSAKEISIKIPEWDDIVQNETVFKNANNIGFGRYKSPVVTLENNIYGKPLNYGCHVIEEKIKNVLKLIENEFKYSGIKLFASDDICRDIDKNGNPTGIYSIDEYIYPIDIHPDSPQHMIEVFSPEIRSSAYFSYLTQLLEQYQSLLGVGELITHEKSSNSQTATEIKMLNVDNISTEDSVRKAIRTGNIETLEADSMYLGIRPDLWTYDETWCDVYDDEQQRLTNMLNLYNAGALELIDVVKYWFPALTDEQIQKKVDRLEANKKAVSLDDFLGTMEK